MFQLESSLEGMNIVNVLVRRGNANPVTVLLLHLSRNAAAVSSSHPPGTVMKLPTPFMAAQHKGFDGGYDL
jgi:hypothetical protein